MSLRNDCRLRFTCSWHIFSGSDESDNADYGFCAQFSGATIQIDQSKEPTEITLLGSSGAVSLAQSMIEVRCACCRCIELHGLPLRSLGDGCLCRLTPFTLISSKDIQDQVPEPPNNRIPQSHTYKMFEIIHLFIKIKSLCCEGI